jgi:hypothetical protein
VRIYNIAGYEEFKNPSEKRIYDTFKKEFLKMTGSEGIFNSSEYRSSEYRSYEDIIRRDLL